MAIGVRITKHSYFLNHTTENIHSPYSPKSLYIQILIRHRRQDEILKKRSYSTVPLMQIPPPPHVMMRGMNDLRREF
jgi:hypothetical protein